MDLEEQNKVRELCVKNAEDLVAAARALEGRGVDHVRYHLGVLALEEIGKATLLNTKFAIARHGDPELRPKVVLDDHVKKLFWALWGPAFGHQVLTREQMESYRGLASTIHQNRLDYLYVDPGKPVAPQDKLRPEDADNIVNLAEAAAGMERHGGTLTLDPERAALAEWFIAATDDPAKRGYIMSQESMEKMVELGGVPKWMAWLRSSFDEMEAKSQALTEQEMNRALPTGAEGLEPKWRFKVRLYSESHSIRPKFISEWNKISKYILLQAGGRRDELVCLLTVPKAVAFDQMLDAGWDMSRKLVAALNIGSNGFFWWDVPKEHHFFYDEIRDVETDNLVRAEVHETLRIDWGNQALKVEKLAPIRLLMSYMAKVHRTPMEAAFDFYMHGLALIAKSDLHVRFETNAFEQFFKAFKSSLFTAGDWNGKGDLKAAADRGIGYEVEELERCLLLGSAVEQAKAAVPGITLQDVVWMKNFCDLYLLILAMREVDLTVGDELETDVARPDGGSGAPPDTKA